MVVELQIFVGVVWGRFGVIGNVATRFSCVQARTPFVPWKWNVLLYGIFRLFAVDEGDSHCKEEFGRTLEV